LRIGLGWHGRTSHSWGAWLSFAYGSRQGVWPGARWKSGLWERRLRWLCGGLVPSLCLNLPQFANQLWLANACGPDGLVPKSVACGCLHVLLLCGILGGLSVQMMMYNLLRIMEGRQRLLGGEAPTNGRGLAATRVDPCFASCCGGIVVATTSRRSMGGEGRAWGALPFLIMCGFPV
jgi:hypothetical protein